MGLTSLIGGTWFFIFGVLTCIGSYKLGLGALNRPGSGLFPFIGGLIVATLSIIDIAKGLSTRGLSINKFLSLWEGANLGKAASLFSLLLMHVFVLDMLGFCIPTFLYIGFCLWLLGVRRWPLIMIVSFFCTLGFCLLILFFELPLPLLPKSLLA